MDRKDAAKKLIINDLKGVMDAYSRCEEGTRAHFMLGGLLYFSTIISGAVDWCAKANLAVNCFADKEIIDKLRAKVKLYSNDDVIPLEQQRILMSNIIRVEKQYWVDLQEQSGEYCPKFLISDIGSYLVNSHYIGNTLEYAYEYSPLNSLGIPILEALGGESRDSSLAFTFGIQLGKTLQELYSKISGQAYILPQNNKCQIEIMDRDFRMDSCKFFKKQNAIFAFNLCCRINYLLEVFFPLCERYPMLAFRMMYITFYHLEADLKSLGLEFVHYNMPYRNQYFRNAMAHYSLFGKISDGEIIEDVVGFGLLEKFFGKPFDAVNRELINEFRKTRDSLEEYVII